MLFANPGLYGAITGLGAGGGRPSSTSLADVTNCTLYAVFCITGFCAGSILNTIGPRFTFTLGAFWYPFYASGLFYYDRTGNEVYPIFGGALLGFGAGCMWSAAGYIQLVYAEEKDKGYFIIVQYFASSFGSTVGALIAFALDIHGTTSTGVPTSVYIIFIVIMLSAVVFGGIFLQNPRNLRRDDGTHLAIFPHHGFKVELKALAHLIYDWRILVLLPAFFVTELGLPLESSINANYFNLRTRSLCNVMFWAIQIPATIALYPMLDNTHLRRRTRGLIGVTYTCIIVLVAYILNISFAATHVLDRSIPGPSLDWTDSGFGWVFTGYLFFGMIYTAWPIVCVWIIGSVCNDAGRLARYAGLFKGSSSLGMTIFFGVDSALTPWKNQIYAQFVLMLIGLAILYTVSWKFTTDTNYFREDTVIPPKHVIEEADKSVVQNGRWARDPEVMEI